MQRLLILVALAAPIRALRQPRAGRPAPALQRSASAAAAPAVRAPPRTSEPAAPPTLRAPPGATLRILSESPRVAVVDDMLTAAECEALIAHASRRGLERSNPSAAQFDAAKLRNLAPLLLAAPLPRAAATFEATGGDVAAAAAAGGAVLALAGALTVALAQVVRAVSQARAAGGRTSEAVALNGAADAALAAPLVARLAAALGASPRDFEAPVVTRYERGAKFATHNDASADPERDWGDNGGQRLATVILYLNDVAAGGETSFDKLDVAVAPRRGAACVFFPADADSHRADDRTTHASLPAVDTKWICQVWRRARRVPPPLGLPADAS